MRGVYRLYVDEVGTDGLTNLKNDNNRYLSLTGTAIKLDHARDYLSPMLGRLKADIFDADPDSPIFLHRKDIMGGKGVFEMIRTDKTFQT